MYCCQLASSNWRRKAAVQSWLRSSTSAVASLPPWAAYSVDITLRISRRLRKRGTTSSRLVTWLGRFPPAAGAPLGRRRRRRFVRPAGRRLRRRRRRRRRRRHHLRRVGRRRRRRQVRIVAEGRPHRRPRSVAQKKHLDAPRKLGVSSTAKR